MTPKVLFRTSDCLILVRLLHYLKEKKNTGWVSREKRKFCGRKSRWNESPPARPCRAALRGPPAPADAGASAPAPRPSREVGDWPWAPGSPEGSPVQGRLPAAGFPPHLRNLEAKAWRTTEAVSLAQLVSVRICGSCKRSWIFVVNVLSLPSFRGPVSLRCAHRECWEACRDPRYVQVVPDETRSPRPRAHPALTAPLSRRAGRGSRAFL